MATNAAGRGACRVRLVLALVAACTLVTLAGAARAHAFIYWADPLRGNIGRASIDGVHVEGSFISGANQPCGIAVDDRYIYWANSGSGTIGRATLDGTQVNQNFITGGSAPCGVSTDPLNGGLYWANTDSNTIATANNDGTGVNQSYITNPGTQFPPWTASLGGYVYWPTLAFPNLILRSNIGGSGAQMWVPDTAAVAPLALAISPNGLYWTSNARQPDATIGHVDFDGSNPNGVFLNAPGACGIAANDTNIYWSTNLGTIGRATLNGSGANSNFMTNLTPQICGLAVNEDSAIAHVSPSSLDFGGVLVGSGPTTSQHVTVSNSSPTTVDLGVGIADIVGPGASQFDLAPGEDTCSGTDLPPGGSCTIGVRFSPTSLGGKGATLEIISNDPDSPELVPLSGTGTDPDEDVAPAFAHFGNRLIGTQSQPQTFTLENQPSASAPDVIGQATLAGADADQYSITSDGCSNTTVAIGGTCQISVRFAPTALGPSEAALSIPSDDPTSPATVFMSGTGTAPDESVLPGSIAFGNQQTGTASSTRMVTVQNTANATGPLQVGSVALAGADPSSFDLVFDGCSGQLLSPGDACEVGARFAPAEAGGRSASIQIPSNGSTSPVSVDLSGAGEAPAPAPPSNQFSLSGPKFLKGGRARLPVIVPGEGQIVLSGKGVRSRTMSAPSAGTFKLLVVSAGKPRRRVLRKGSARVHCVVTFTPTGGSPSAIPVTLTLVDRNTF